MSSGSLSRGDARSCSSPSSPTTSAGSGSSVPGIASLSAGESLHGASVAVLWSGVWLLICLPPGVHHWRRELTSLTANCRAGKGSRTLTPLRAQRPERCVSTSSTIPASLAGYQRRPRANPSRQPPLGDGVEAGSASADAWNRHVLGAAADHVRQLGGVEEDGGRVIRQVLGHALRSREAGGRVGQRRQAVQRLVEEWVRLAAGDVEAVRRLGIRAPEGG